MAWVNNMQKIGDVWWIRVKQGGREIRRSTGKKTPEAARLWLLQFRTALDQIEEGNAPAPTLAALVSSWEKAHAKIHSDAHVSRVTRDARLYVLPKYGEIPADQLSTAIMSEIRSDFLTGCTAQGREHTRRGANGIHRHMRLIYKWGVEVGKLKVVPWRLTALKTFRKPKITLDADLVPKFLAEVKKARNPHVYVAVMAQLYLGLRESESLQMRWEHFAKDLSTFIPGKFSEEGDGFRSKGGEADALPVPEQLRAAIRALVPHGEALPRLGWVLPAKRTRKDDPLLPHAPQFQKKAIVRAGKAVGVAGLTSHRLRGTCATLMARAGVDPFVIQAFMRHADLQTTMEYVEVRSRNLKAAQGALLGGMVAGSATAEADLKTSKKKG